jgi:hypothetical protein
MKHKLTWLARLLADVKNVHGRHARDQADLRERITAQLRLCVTLLRRAFPIFFRGVVARPQRGASVCEKTPKSSLNMIKILKYTVI